MGTQRISSTSSFGSNSPSIGSISHQSTRFERPWRSRYSFLPMCSPRAQRQPVSSSTSRSAACSSDSPGSSLPFGRLQSWYFGRWTTRTSVAVVAAAVDDAAGGADLGLGAVGGAHGREIYSSARRGAALIIRSAGGDAPPVRQEDSRPFARELLLRRAAPFALAMAVSFAVLPLGDEPVRRRLACRRPHPGRRAGARRLVRARGQRLPAWAEAVPPLAWFGVVALLRASRRTAR